MTGKLLPFLTLMLGIGLVGLTSPQAADPQTREGMVVSAGSGQLVVSDMAGKEQTHSVGTEAKVTVHGKPARLEDLKLGMRVRVTMEGPGKVLAVTTVDDLKVTTVWR
jgi:hypothetical protein